MKRTLVDAHGDGKAPIGRLVECDDIVQFWRETTPLVASSQSRGVPFVRRIVCVRHETDVSEARKTDDVILPRVPRLADIKLSTHDDA